MELANIERLVEKYLNAETTLQEEQVLQDYFSSNNVAPNLQEYAFMFGYFNQSRDETFNKTIQLKPETKLKKNWKWLSVAASFALLVSTYIGIQMQENRLKRQQLAQITEALEMVSVTLNRGNNALYTVSNSINIGQDAIHRLNTYEKSVNNVLQKLNY